MPPFTLPPRPNLEQLRKQAKDLLKAYRSGEPSAVVRLRESLPWHFRNSGRRVNRPPLSLRDAQQAVALENGFSDWSRLRKSIQEREAIPMQEVTVERVVVNPDSPQGVIVLKGKEVHKYLPIWVAASEGDGIALRLQGKELPRPMTHDLMDSMISDLGGRVERAVVSDLRDNIFVAKVVVQQNATTMESDCRPSDAIALAIRNGAPIYVEEVVFEQAGIVFDPKTGLPESPSSLFAVTSIDDIGEAFTEEARKQLEEAKVHAVRLGNKEIAPADILWSVMNEPEGAGAKVMNDLGLDLGDLRSKLEQREGPDGAPSSGGSPDFNPASQRALGMAKAEAGMFLRGQVGTDHILVGLMLADGDLASLILMDTEVEIQTVRGLVVGTLEDAKQVPQVGTGQGKRGTPSSSVP